MLEEPKGASRMSQISVLLEDDAINEHVGASTGVMHADWYSYSDSFLHRGFIQHSSVPSYVGDGFAETIAHRTVGFPEDNRAAWSVLCDCPAGFSGSRCLSGGSRPRWLRYILLLHKRLPQGLPPRKRCHHGQHNTQHCFHFCSFLVAMATSFLCSRSLIRLGGQLGAVLRFECNAFRGCRCVFQMLLKRAFAFVTPEWFFEAEVLFFGAEVL